MHKATSTLTAGVIAASALMTGVFSAQAEDKYLESVEQRLERLEREINVMRGDAKGKDILSEDIPVYVKPKSKFITDVKLRGRIQWQFGYVVPTSDGGFANVGGTPVRSNDNYSTFEIRRARIGIEAKLMNDFKAMVEINAVPGNTVLNEAYIQYQGTDVFQPVVGLVKPRFGYEENTSSAKILTVERSNLTNTLATDQKIGLAIEGEANIIFYSAGIYNNVDRGVNNGVQPDENDTNAFFRDVEYIYNASAGLDFTDIVGFKLQLRADYAYAQSSPELQGPAAVGALYRNNGNVGFAYQNNVAASIVTGFGPFELSTEFIGGFQPNAGGGVSNNANVYGFYVMPSYYVIPERLQVVAQYTWMEGKGGAGFRSPSRYASDAFFPNNTGDEYQAIYGGLNYYINGNDLKVMLGVEYSMLGGIPNPFLAGNFQNANAVTFFSAVRMQF